MSHSWLAYVPPHLAADLLAYPTVSPLDRVQHQRAVALFADISGFTAMSEALGQVGSKGTEELSQILNRTFGAMIGIIHSYGGSIGKFAGDAITVVFPVIGEQDVDLNPQPVARRAVQCALDMQDAIMRAGEYQTSAGVFRLAMRIGLGMGDLITTTVGDPSIRLEYLLAGSAINHCTDAAQHAVKGAVIVCDDLLPLAGTHKAQPITSGFSRITRLRRRPAPISCPHPPAPAAMTIATITRYLPPAIVARLDQGQPGFVDEHRTITTLFVHFAGFDYQDSVALEALQHYLREVIQVSDRYGGYLRQVDVGDKGSLFIVLFGAPLSHEDDTERALLCALELRTTARQLGITTATGITTGRIFCGMVGSDVRREYAAIGDSVNLAARLMSAAQPDQILVDATTRQRSSTTFLWADLPPLIVKGKTAPVVVAALEKQAHRSPTRLRAPSYALAMVGRQTELNHCLELLNRAQAGKGQIIGISAEAGMGKSRLVVELLRSTPAKQFLALSSECLSYGIHSSYLVWQGLLRGLIDLTPQLSLTAQHARIAEVVQAIDPQLVERAPLLGVTLNIPLPDNDLTRNMDAKLRKESLEQLVVTCLRHWAKQRPLLLVLEDCHWIDPLSNDLLFALAQHISDVPLVLLVTHRPFQTEHTDDRIECLQVSTLPHYHAIRLTEFTREETAELIALKLDRLFGRATEVPAALLDPIVERAQGNPFYIDELLNLLHDRGLDPRDVNALMRIELPDTVQRVILSRIDRLAEGPKTTLKLASVVGRLFRAQWVWELKPQLGGPEVVQRYLDTLQSQELTQLERQEPELEYLFKHLITREVAYESLSLRTRLSLHEQVGAYIEQVYAADLERWLDVLAYHYGLSANTAKQREYFRKAGDASRQRYANAAAIHYYQRLLPLLPEEAQGEVLALLAGVEQFHGRWQDAEQHARAALALAQRFDNAEVAVDATNALGNILRFTGRLDEAVSLMESLRQQLLTQAPSPEFLQLLTNLGYALYRQGRYEESLTLSQGFLEYATSLNDPYYICNALNGIGIVQGAQQQYEAAIDNFERALQLATTHHFPRHICSLLGNLGIMRQWLGSYDQALSLYQRGLEVALQIGFQEIALWLLIRMGWAYSSLGMDQQASRCLYASFAFLGDSLSSHWLLEILEVLARITVQDGRAGLAKALLTRGSAVAHQLVNQRHLVVFSYLRALLLMQEQVYEEAHASLTEVFAQGALPQIVDLQLPVQLLAIHLQVLCGEVEIADAIAQVEVLQQEWTKPSQQAAIAYTIWQIDPSQEDTRQRSAEQYRLLYAETPDIEYRRRYQELTGDELPEPPPFPEPPAIVDQHQIDIDELLRRVDSLLAEGNA